LPAALNEIRDKIAGENGLFDDGPLQKLIISWGDQKEAYKRFNAAVQILPILAREDSRNDRHGVESREVEIVKSREDRERNSVKIAKIETLFRDESQIACKSLCDIAASAGGSSVLAGVISEMCDGDDLLDEVRRRTPREVALMIHAEINKDAGVHALSPFCVFASFVEQDLAKVLEDHGNRQRMLTLFKSSTKIREQIENLRAQPKSVAPKDDTTAHAKEGWTGLLVSAAVTWSSKLMGTPRKNSSGVRMEEGEETIMQMILQVQNAGLETWAQELRNVVVGDKDVNAVLPSEWRLYLILLSCKSLLAKLRSTLPCAWMDDPRIKNREIFERNRRRALKEMVGKETLRHAIQRFSVAGFPRLLTNFVDKYEEASHMVGKKTKPKSKRFHHVQDRLFKLFEQDSPDGRPAHLLDALPIWIMPTDLVSEMLPAQLGLFDLIIFEEASLSDCEALPAILRGKKLVVIGDNKQMNPPDSSDDYKQMILEKLGNDLPRDTCENLLPGKSIFDLFATAYNGPETTIRLREHFRSSSHTPYTLLPPSFFQTVSLSLSIYIHMYVFVSEHWWLRCLPEIIGFSNELCYDNCLIPMRESQPGFGLAIQMKFVEGGSSTVIKPVNLEEAKMIVKQVCTCTI